MEIEDLEAYIRSTDGARMIPIKPGNVPRLWPSRYRLLALWGGATFIPEPLVWPPLGSGVASARAV